MYPANSDARKSLPAAGRCQQAGRAECDGGGSHTDALSPKRTRKSRPCHPERRAQPEVEPRRGAHSAGSTGGNVPREIGRSFGCRSVGEGLAPPPANLDARMDAYFVGVDVLDDPRRRKELFDCSKIVYVGRAVEDVSPYGCIPFCASEFVKDAQKSLPAAGRLFRASALMLIRSDQAHNSR